MMDPESVFEIGKRNYLALRRILWKAGILLHGEAVGGVNRGPCAWKSAPASLAAGGWHRSAAASAAASTPDRSRREESWHIAS